MTRLAAVAALLAGVLPSVCLAQYGGMGGGMGGYVEVPVKVETIGGQSVSGAILLISVVVDCDLGEYHVNPRKVRSIRFAGPPENGQVGPKGVVVAGVVTTTSGSEISGRVYVQQWIVKTDLGQVTLAPEKLKTLTFPENEKKADKGEAKPKERADPPAEKK